MSDRLQDSNSKNKRHRSRVLPGVLVLYVCCLASLALSLFVLCLNSEFCEPVNFAFNMNNARLTFDQQVRKNAYLLRHLIPKLHQSTKTDGRKTWRKSTSKTRGCVFLTGRPHAAQRDGGKHVHLLRASGGKKTRPLSDFLLV